MAERRGGINSTMAFLLGAAVVALGVIGYLYYDHTQKDVVEINVPGFQGEIEKE
ncbi:hypothetical protein A7A08_03150 [Methyloligella halotolerans]|uniref:Uncharacterized protein n=1 Tax=Methyloligella halotolerans TaxID=1177755 RepID=A0A1E2RUS3_9HYPH|nr:hypothetical protein [Methyloligella halotolerans]ODA66006.1 hypothetical protein A7A08_03150 [Methyloligella halotolerans]